MPTNMNLFKDQQGENNYSSVLTEQQVRHVCRLLEEDRYELKEISRMTGVSISNINQIKAGNNWRFISREYNIKGPKKIQRSPDRYGLTREELGHEIWEPVVIDFEELHYEVSNMGRVRNTNTGKILTPRDNSQGYYKVSLGLGTSDRTVNCFIHRLVLNAFSPIENSKSMEIEHIDRCRNNNRASNLRWITRSENMSKQFNEKPYKSKNGSSSAESTTMDLLYQLLETGVYSYRELEYITKVSYTSIINIVNKRRRVIGSNNYDIKVPMRACREWCVLHTYIMNKIIMGYTDNEIVKYCIPPKDLSEEEFYHIVSLLRDKYKFFKEKLNKSDKEIFDFFTEYLPIDKLEIGFIK